MNHDNCDCVSDLIYRLGMGKPLWPVPTYCQDMAVIAFFLHKEREPKNADMGGSK